MLPLKASSLQICDYLWNCAEKKGIVTGFDEDLFLNCFHMVVNRGV